MAWTDHFRLSAFWTAGLKAASKSRPLLGAVLLSAAGAHMALAAQELTLDHATGLAVERDPVLQSLGARAKALEERAVADRQWPDPVVKLGLANFPARSFKYTKEGMTQIQLGVQQVIPRGKTLPLRAKQTQAKAAIERAKAQDRRARIVLETRKAWLDLYYWIQARRITEEERTAFQNLIEAIDSLYSAGRRNQQDLVSAELELSLVEDHLIDLNRQIETARSELAKWITANEAQRPLPSALPALPEIASPADLRNALPLHPLILAADAAVSVNERAVALARQAYKPQFRVDLTYGFRGGTNVDGSGREDFATAMLFLDVPLIRKRQDRQLSASKLEASAARFDRSDRLRELTRMLDNAYANWLRLGEREAYFKGTILARARQNAQAARMAYQNDLVPFADLVRAQLAEFDTQLRLIKVQVDKAKAHSALLYLMGGAS